MKGKSENVGVALRIECRFQVPGDADRHINLCGPSRLTADRKLPCCMAMLGRHRVGGCTEFLGHRRSPRLGAACAELHSDMEDILVYFLHGAHKGKVESTGAASEVGSTASGREKIGEIKKRGGGKCRR